ncbi:myosin regulatory light polypeptide 9 [Exaiptasia diaphana]|uniref:EF-hand domain-containing protein n=1 Tax=Exaiptasia diaphana TaxID=2652724 RepID=A0A913WPM8_EXADI|nr:myosin regulatory light polypeptide 9 [Exaiptasia diaphana]KXJ28180.1 Myosin regulatory light chain sqh [Exaiptasia diaphana]
MSAKAKDKKKGGTKKKAQRATSNVFAMFDQAQIQEFKEAFNMIDQNRDGFISKDDLAATFDSLGKLVKDDYLEEMLNEASGPINFTMFLTLFGEKISGTDPEDVIKAAFASFDIDGKGFVDEEKLRRLMQGLGDRFTDDEWDMMMDDCPVDSNGILYNDFVHLIKYGPKDD